MTEWTETTELPVTGVTYSDVTGGRELLVTAVNPADPQGRDVVGLVSSTPRNGHAPRAYATSLVIFSKIWEAA